MSPGPIQRLKPYFKPRPRTRPTGANAPAPSQDATPAAAPVAQPQAVQPAAPQPQAVQPAAAGAPAAQPGAGAELERRREQLARRYGELESDLGGLVYEMAIRDHFRLDVVVRRAADLQAVDAELTAVEQALAIGSTPNATAACRSCGAPLGDGAQFCGRCGAGVAPPAGASSSAAPNATPIRGGSAG